VLVIVIPAKRSEFDDLSRRINADRISAEHFVAGCRSVGKDAGVEPLGGSGDDGFRYLQFTIETRMSPNFSRAKQVRIINNTKQREVK